MSETALARLSIEVHVDCPNCDNYIDLMDEKDTNGTDHNEEGHVVSQACPDGSWYDKHKQFNITNVTCTDCGETFNVEGLEW